MSVARWAERGVAAAIGAALAVALTAGDGAAPPTVVEPPARAAEGPRAPRLLPAPAPEPRYPSRAAPRHTAPEAARSDAPAARRVVRVRVRDADGAPVDEGTVYALPAGDPGADAAWQFPHADLGEDLEVGGDGPWDVGVVHGLRHALARDVVVQAGDAVEVPLVLPRVEPISFRVVGSVPRIEGGWLRSHVQVTAIDGARKNYPGRDEAPAISLGFFGPPSQTAPLPPGRYRLSAFAGVERPGTQPGTQESAALHGFALEVRPDEASPGETAVLQWREAGALTVRLKTRGSTWPSVPVTFSVRLADGARTEVRSFESEGVGLGRTDPSPIDFAVTSGRARVVVEGRGVAAEAFDVDVRRGGRVERDVTLRFDEATSLVSPRPLEVRIEGGLPSEADEGGVSVGFLAALPPGREALSRDGRSYLSDSTRADGGRSTLPPVWREVDVVVAQFGPAWASHPTPVPRSGPLRIALEPAGLVVVVPDRLDSEAAGVLTLRHEDGRPVEHSSSTDSVIEFTVEAGTLLGPLPAGSHRFHVRRGGRSLGSVDVDVVAGRVVPLLLSD